MQHPAVSGNPSSSHNPRHRDNGFLVASRLQRLVLMPLLMPLLMLLASCGGGGAGGSYDSGNGSGNVSIEPPVTTGPVVRVEVTPAALMLTANGQSQALMARAFDAQDREVRAAPVWQATRAEQVSVDASGKVQAQVALGGGQVRAVVDGVRSAPVLVSVAQPQPGVILVNDDQVVSVPTAADPAASSDPNTAYDVVLSGIAAPAPGSLLLGREGVSLGGEVVTSATAAGGVRVRLKGVPIARLMKTAQLKEEIDLRGLPLQVPPDIAALYDVTQQDDLTVFTPKPVKTGSSDRKHALGKIEKTLGPFKCELISANLPVSFAQPAQFSMKFEPRYLVDYDQTTGLQAITLKADTTFKFKLALQFSLAGLVGLSCDATPYRRLAPLPGWAGLVLAGEIKAGVGFEMEGTATIPALGAELTAEVKGPMEAGLDCSSGTCVVKHAWEPQTTNTLRFITPDDALANARSEFFLFTYGFAKLAAGLTLVDQARVDAVSARGGLKFETALAPLATQLAPVDASLPDYRSDYKLQALAEVTAGSFNGDDSGLRKLLQNLGVFKVTLLKAQLSTPLGVSPKGTTTVDREVFVDGDRLNFKVKIDPATSTFPLLGYNVKRVRILRTATGLLPREVTSAEPTAPGQTDFDLSWDASGTNGESNVRFHAFVDTVLPMPVSLELGPANLAQDAFSGNFSLNYSALEVSPNGFSRSNQMQVGGNVTLSGNSGFVFSGGNASLTGQTGGGSATIDTSFNGGECTGTTTSTSSSSSSGSGKPVRLFATVADGQWVLRGVEIDPMNTTVNRQLTVVVGGLRGNNCSGVSTQPATSGSTGTTQGSMQVPFLNFEQPLLTGPLVSGSDGKQHIQARGAAQTRSMTNADGTQVTETYSVTMDIAGQVAGSTDLAVVLTARPFAEPLGLMTYAVNISNLGNQAANEVRAELTLPAGWVLKATTGWSGCETAGSTVTCRAGTLAAGDRRAFLVDVQAPNGTGRFTATARVAATEGDPDSTNNSAQALTVIEL